MAKKNIKKNPLKKNNQLAKTKNKNLNKKNLKPKIIEKKINKSKTKNTASSKKIAPKILKKDLKKTPPKKLPPKKKIKEPKKIKDKKSKIIKPNKVKSSKKVNEQKIKKAEKIVEQTAPQSYQNKRQKNNKKIDPKANQPFKVNEYAVYPAHGVGKIIEIQTTKIMNQDYSCYLIFFEKEKLTIKVPVANSQRIGLRRIVSKSQMEEVLGILRSGIKKLKGMWSRRAQEYETKINSGDIFMLAEVLRDLTRDIEDSERSYSERIIYETAIFRLASEYAIIYNADIESAKEKIINIAKDKINSESKSSSKDDFDDFDFEDRKSKNDGDEEEEEDDEEDEEEEDDFNYDFNEIDEDDDDDDKPRKKRK